VEKNQDCLRFDKEVECFIKGLNEFVLIFPLFFLKSVKFREHFVKNQETHSIFHSIYSKSPLISNNVEDTAEGDNPQL